MWPLLSSCGGRDCDDAGRFAALVRPPLRILRGRAERLRRHHPGGRAAPVADRQPGSPGACSSLACGVAGRAAWVGADVVGLFGATTWTHEQTMERHRPCISRTWGAKA